MITQDIHSLNLESEKDFEYIQRKLATDISLENRINEEDIRYCAGVDIAYWQRDGIQYGACSIIVIDYNTKDVIEKTYSHGIIDVPYIPGFLAFRELPLVIEAVHKLVVEPDIFVFDGNGYLHFSHMGIATHASFFLDKPTIGVAKSYLKINDTEFIEPDNKEGSYTDILIGGTVYGRALRTRVNVKPVFISCGNYIDLDTTTDILLRLTNSKESRIPIPTRLADIETHQLRERLK